MKNVVLGAILLLSGSVHALEVRMNCVRSNPRERLAVEISDSWIGINRMSVDTGVRVELEGHRIDQADQSWTYQLDGSSESVTIPTHVLMGSLGKGIISVGGVRFHCLIRRL